MIDECGLLVKSSRGIIYASLARTSPKPPHARREAAKRMAEQLRDHNVF